MATPGLARIVVGADGFVIPSAWYRAVEEGRIVGLCNAPMRKGEPCSGYLKPDPAHQIGNRTWFGCRCAGCGHEYVAPLGKVLPVTSRREHMPEGAWDRRMEHVNRVLGKKEAA